MSTFTIPPYTPPRQGGSGPLPRQMGSDTMRDIAARIRMAQEERTQQEALRQQATFYPSPAAPLGGQVTQALQNTEADSHMRPDPESVPPSAEPQPNPWDQSDWAQRVNQMRTQNTQDRNQAAFDSAEPTAPMPGPDDSIDGDDVAAARGRMRSREMEAIHDRQVREQADWDRRREMGLPPMEESIDDAVSIDVPIPEPMADMPELTDIDEAAMQGEAAAWDREARPEDLAPLPNEETLSDQAFAFERSNPGSMDRLKIAWMLSGGQDKSSFEDWLSSMSGDTGELGVLNFDAALAKADKLIESRSKYKKYSLNEDGTLKSEDSDFFAEQKRDTNGRRWREFQRKRLQRGMDPTTNVSAMIRGFYDRGLEEAQAAGIPIDKQHAYAIQFANKAGLEALYEEQHANRLRAMAQRADQYNRGRYMGMSPGTVALFDDLQQADTPEKMIGVFAALHAQNPQGGWDQMAHRMMQGNFDANALRLWAGNVVGQRRDFGTDITNFNSSPYDDTRYARLMDIAQKSSPPGSKPEDVRAKARETSAPEVSRLINQAVFGGAPLPPAQMSYVRQVVAGMTYVEFLETYGLQGSKDDPRVKRFFSSVSGQPARSGWGDWFGSIGGFFGGLFEGGEPKPGDQARAQPPRRPFQDA